jgi:glucosamine--fructose-6-phosphate aminotransferase (isomerizing)
MCGIIGYVGDKDVTPILMNGLKRLEYRGYDSAGICVVNGTEKLSILRAVGKIAKLDALVAKKPPKGVNGLGHSRWATHGPPTEENAHPHTDGSGKLVVIHNGIIENYREIKERLAEAGCRFASETDTEILAHLVSQKIESLRPKMSGEKLLFEATRAALKEVRGAYAIAVLWSETPGVLIAAKTASPLVIGLGENEAFVASDVPAFLEHTRRVVFLDDGEMAIVRKNKVDYFTLGGKSVKKDAQEIKWDRATAEKEGYRHFMLKEIYEQPVTVSDTIRGRLFPVGARSLKRETGLTPADLKGIERVHLLACGTAHHAGLIGRYWIEQFAGVPAEAEMASEFRYREPVLSKKTLVIAVSQSGETADTLAAAQLAQEKGAKLLAVCNNVGSALMRRADHDLLTHCGPEYGVASTKAFVGQLTALALFAFHLAVAKGRLQDQEARSFVDDLSRLPGWIEKALKLDEKIAQLARIYKNRKHFLYIGRNVNYPLALEGALKLKEISYIHAEGYAAGEMKHGPIALIDEMMPLVAIATESETFDKVLSNIEESKARGATVIAVATEGDKRMAGAADHVLFVPKVPEFLSPIVNVVPLQLLAYHIANELGCDVDQPRNLAKSVTVE